MTSAWPSAHATNGALAFRYLPMAGPIPQPPPPHCLTARLPRLAFNPLVPISNLRDIDRVRRQRARRCIPLARSLRLPPAAGGLTRGFGGEHGRLGGVAGGGGDAGGEESEEDEGRDGLHRGCWGWLVGGWRLRVVGEEVGYGCSKGKGVGNARVDEWGVGTRRPRGCHFQAAWTPRGWGNRGGIGLEWSRPLRSALGHAFDPPIEHASENGAACESHGAPSPSGEIRAAQTSSHAAPPGGTARIHTQGRMWQHGSISRTEGFLVPGRSV